MEDTLNELQIARRHVLQAKDRWAEERAELKRLILQARAEGVGLAEIGQAAGVSPQRVYQITQEE